MAVIPVEPLQAAGGYISATREFLQFLRQAANDTGAILIFDEIVTSRLHTGELQEQHDVYPDMKTLGKYVGGGFSFGAWGGRKEIMRQLDPRLPVADGGLPHSGTFNNNIFSMMAGVEAGRLLTAERIACINVLGDRLRDGLSNLLREHNISNYPTHGAWQHDRYSLEWTRS